MIFSKTHCPFCVKAKQVFQKHLGKDLDEKDYEVLEMEDMDDCADMQSYLGQLTGGRTVSSPALGLQLVQET